MKGDTATDMNLKKEDESADVLLEGRLTIFQKLKGYRFSIDSLLLAHFIMLKRGDRVIDLGAGSGIISLVLAYRFKSVRIVGVEIQEELVDMARRSVAYNNLESRIDIRHGDARHIKKICEPQSFSVAVFNPPYRKLNSGRMNPDQERAIARHEIAGSLENFLGAARYVMKDGGTVFAIYPARRGAELFYQMRKNRLEPKNIRMVHSHASSHAEFILVEGIKRGGEELTVGPPLFIYGDDGSYSAETKGIFREIATPDGNDDS
jgi:tRNA1Val (adenine37-N6)-methyltransferase